MDKRLAVAVGAAFVWFACGKTQSMPVSSAPPTVADAGSPPAAVDAGTPPVGPGDAGTGGTGSGGPTGGAGGGGSGSGGGGGGSSGGGGIDAGTPDAGTTAALEQLTQGQAAAGLALDATNVYWINIGSLGSFELRTMPKAGGAPQTVASGSPPGGPDPVGGFISAGGHWWWTGPVSLQRDGVSIAYAYGQVAASDTRVYTHAYNGNDDFIIAARNFDGSGFRVIANDVGDGEGVLLDGGRLYFTEVVPRGGQIVWTAPEGGAQTAIMRPGPERPAYLKAAGGYVFFRDRLGDVERVPQDGVNSSPELLWGAPNGTDLDLKDGRVYWNQDQTRDFPGCIGVANYDGTDGHCLDEGAHTYRGVRVDDDSVFFIRDGNVFRLPRQ